MVKRLRTLALAMTAVGCAAVAFAQLSVKTATVVVGRDGKVMSVNGVPVGQPAPASTAAQAATPAPSQPPQRRGFLDRVRESVEKQTGAGSGSGQVSTGASSPCREGFVPNPDNAAECVRRGGALEEAAELADESNAIFDSLDAAQLAGNPVTGIPDALLIEATIALSGNAKGSISPAVFHAKGGAYDTAIVNFYKGGMGYDAKLNQWTKAAFTRFVVETAK